ncbi:hypothetical protein ACJVC5_16695 [Peredibacter sp. HCB2-198]|uniref:hypothetical protein n=1 Tax=Peredibacter sp. HCB2-198 TaxID=3383025 RepID=UPI0038B506CD
MAALDLKPLSKETIDKMGFNNHDLWMVKIGEELFGPFESQSLKHYATENENVFDNALASRLDTNDYHPFWTHAFFQRRTPENLSKEKNEGPFWTLNQGQKQGPFSFQDIDKKIEMGLLVMTDHLSVDNGDTWRKIFEFTGFDRRIHSASELPEAPQDSSFQKARLLLVDKIEKPHLNTHVELAELAHQGQMQAKVLTLKLDEMTLSNLKSTEVSDSLKWAVPAAAAIFMAMMVGGYFLLNPSSEIGNVELVAEKEAPQNISDPLPAPVGEVPANRPGPQVSNRRPASVPSYNPPRRPVITSRFPTRVETHMRDRDQMDEPPVEPQDMPEQHEPPPAPEHSLVGNDNNNQGETLDAAMNGTSQPAEPVVEEVSDF